VAESIAISSSVPPLVLRMKTAKVVAAIENEGDEGGWRMAVVAMKMKKG